MDKASLSLVLVGESVLINLMVGCSSVFIDSFTGLVLLRVVLGMVSSMCRAEFGRFSISGRNFFRFGFPRCMFLFLNY